MAGALSAQELSTAQAQITFLAPNAAQRQKDRRRWGRPTTRTPGGTRDRCAQRLIALVPSPDAVALSSGQCLEESVSDRALTLTETPTLWFYVPPLAEPERRAELVLLQKHREVSKQRVTLPATPGIFGVQLKGPLAANQLYGWSFTVLKQPQSPSQNPTVEGLIRYATSNPKDLRVAHLPDQAYRPGQLRQYAQSGIWHDALTALAQQRCQNPASQSWKSFLASAGLDAIATQPILNCEVL
ncbi:hypothetical protein C1752_00225 [Acaryochloris thomasi RCC1774]|uniref:DUF928 domain-containing protein n=1 Tax=Acaryochloris thomasi RCC1774 TaxID=1764569 RepID=A0A2W1JPT4_9CYAN|nr:DUF928 domain-containing protein [Acaryochloris thomasi]PZD75256.1 hypothetical protein C1752_00225 [Acaryochloris thomasi RCC1774]